VGGVIVWKFLPQSGKAAVAQTITPNDPATLDPTAFKWNSLCENTTASADCCNGVPGLCDLPASGVMFAGVHNAHATVENGWLFAGNHEFSLEKALLYGYRGINVDVGGCDGQLRMIHGNCRLGQLDPAEAWTNITTFLDNNPNEVVLLTIEIVTQDDEVNVTLSGIRDTMPQGFLDLLYTDNPTAEFPTLQELIDAGQRILLFHYAGPSCSEETCPPGFREWFYYGAETKFDNENVEAISCPIDRGSNGIQLFYAINDFVTDPLPSRSSAETVNTKAFLENLVDSCSGIENRDVNVVWIDFWEEGDLVEVTQRHNLQRVQQQSGGAGNRELASPRASPQRQPGSQSLRSSWHS
jgi:hypothetical protein